MSSKAVSSATKTKSTENTSDEAGESSKFKSETSTEQGIIASDERYKDELKRRNIPGCLNTSTDRPELNNLGELIEMLEVPRLPDPYHELDTQSFTVRVRRCSNTATLRDIVSDIFPLKETSSSKLLIAQSKWK